MKPLAVEVAVYLDRAPDEDEPRDWFFVRATMPGGAVYTHHRRFDNEAAALALAAKVRAAGSVDLGRWELVTNLFS